MTKKYVFGFLVFAVLAIGVVFSTKITSVPDLAALAIGSGSSTKNLSAHSCRTGSLDLAESVFIADTLNHRIQKFDLNGVYIGQWGTSGVGPGQFSYPSAVAVSPSGNVYVVDSNNNRVQVFTGNGVYVSQWGTLGTGNGKFSHPSGITVSSTGDVYVVDSGNKLIQKFNSNGVFLTQWGSSGSGQGQFNSPRGIEVDASGNVYVADFYNNRVQKFDGNGTYITQWSVTNPTDVAIDSTGSVYVTTGVDYTLTNTDYVRQFTANGQFKTSWGPGGNAKGEFASPRAIAVTSTDKIYIVDGPSITFDSHRIQQMTSSGVYSNQWGGLGSGNGKFNAPNGIAVGCAIVYPIPTATVTPALTPIKKIH